MWNASSTATAWGDAAGLDEKRRAADSFQSGQLGIREEGGMCKKKRGRGSFSDHQGHPLPAGQVSEGLHVEMSGGRAVFPGVIFFRVRSEKKSVT